MSDRRQYQREWSRAKCGHKPRKLVASDDKAGIRALCSIGIRQETIARVYGISQVTVSAIKTGRR